MSLAYGKRSVAVFLLMAAFSVIFWVVWVYMSALPQLSEADRLLAAAIKYSTGQRGEAVFVRRARALFDEVLIQFPRSRQAQIALMEKARFEARHGLLKEALEDYERIRRLWPTLPVEVEAACEEASLRDGPIGDPDGAAQIRRAIFNRCLSGATASAATRTASSIPALESGPQKEGHGIFLLVGLKLLDYYSSRARWSEVTAVLEGLLSELPDTPLWDELTFRLAEVYRERVGDRQRAAELYARIVKAPDSPWANFALARMSQMGVSP